MKNLRLSIIASLAICLSTASNATSLETALTSGKISGEFTTTYEKRNFKEDKAQGNYYQDTGYSVGSFALKYETDVWNNFSLTSKFRAYKTIHESKKGLKTWKGVGDASERFWHKDGNNVEKGDRTADIEELYLAYEIDNFSIKTGRQFISSHWINKTQDAVKIDTSYENTSLEAIWSQRQGRIYARDYRPMTKTNGKKGVYQVALTHKFNDTISITAYDAIVPSDYTIMGGKINLNLSGFNLGAHYAKSNDSNFKAGNDINTKQDSNLIHLTASTTVAGFTPYMGYIKVDKEGSFPGWSGAAGETIDPMEEGDYIYEKDAKTIYLGVSKSYKALSATLLHGQTDYLAGTQKRKAKETTLWLGYEIAKNLKANLGYTKVNEDKNSGANDLDQVNLTLTYSF